MNRTDPLARLDVELVEHLAAADALHGRVSHLDDPDGPCHRGLAHDGPGPEPDDQTP